jgi:hypothetical protein
MLERARQRAYSVRAEVATPASSAFTFTIPRCNVTISRFLQLGPMLNI